MYFGFKTTETQPLLEFEPVTRRFVIFHKGCITENLVDFSVVSVLKCKKKKE